MVGVLELPSPNITISNISAHTITLKGAWATNPFNSKILEIKSEVLKKVKDVLVKENITISAPRFAIELTPQSPPSTPTQLQEIEIKIHKKEEKTEDFV